MPMITSPKPAKNMVNIHSPIRDKNGVMRVSPYHYYKMYALDVEYTFKEYLRVGIDLRAMGVRPSDFKELGI